ncbi:hypothetical protein L1987_30174 [Smallanthus sonchifolius]|uniref:Uncharacterized protein n=1 Tax=Smallanthus sonchifolius TaxID=185202 RepID=A0ACB9I234_9ASTR|nr:hypothetical protein L1987_30174 [Smallanthus sonchifolius]
MSNARSHEDSVNNDTEKPSEHSSSSRGTSASRSLNIRLNAELPIAAPAEPPRLPSPRHQPTSIHEVGGPSTPIVGILVGRFPPGSWERDYLTVERVRKLHDQGFEHEMRLLHHQNLMDQVISQLFATHIELHRARDLTKDDVQEIQLLRMKVIIWGLVACVLFALLLPPCPREAYVTGPEPIRTIDLNLPDHPHKHALGKCPMWLPAESSGKDSRKRHEKNPFVQKGHFKIIEKAELSTKAPQVFTPRESTKDYLQLYGYFDWKDEANESLGWLTSRGTDMKARLDFHTDPATDMSGKMNELEQDIMQNHDRTTTAIRDAHIARKQSLVAIAVALVVSLVSIFIQLYR